MAEKQKSDKENSETTVTPDHSSETPQEEVQRVVDPVLEMKELLQRTQANFENYRKQTEKRIDEITETAARSVILDLLPIIDNFGLALKSIDPQTNQEDVVKGIELIYSQLHELLEKYQVKPLDTAGKMFDPYVHEALLKVSSDQPEGTILEEFQKGYTLHDKIIRHARVKISAGKIDKNQPNMNDTNDNTKKDNTNREE